ncbi:MAG: hypothetical protein ACOY5Y_06690 [Pseudomonadota bacterium]
MASSPRPERLLIAVRILALISVALAAMCAVLAWAWKAERDAAACWRAAAEFQLQVEGDCRG